MQATHIWDKLIIHRNKIVLLGLLMLPAGVFAQTFKWARKHNPNYDERKISYGFMIGIHTSAYQVKYSDKFVTQSFDTVHSVLTPFAPGFSLGFLINMRLNSDLDLRFMIISWNTITRMKPLRLSLQRPPWLSSLYC